MKKKNLIIINILLLLASCERNQHLEKELIQEKPSSLVSLSSEQYSQADIVTGKLTNKDISSILKVNGKIEMSPKSKVSISAPLGGYIKFIHLMPGMHIHKGDLLVVLEDIQYIQLQQDYLTAKTQFGLLESEYKRQHELNKNKASSDKIYEQAKASYETQLVLLKSLEQKLLLIGIQPENIKPDNISKSIEIFSPITGYILSVNVNIGKFVNSGEVIIELANPKEMFLALTVFESDINKLTVGQTLWAYPNSKPNKKYSFTADFIRKSIDLDNSSMVYCVLTNADDYLLLGMFMSAEIELSKNNSWVIPASAVVTFDNKNYVFILKSNKEFEMKEIKVGYTHDGLTELLDVDNLTNETFVFKGAYNLLLALKNSPQE